MSIGHLLHNLSVEVQKNCRLSPKTIFPRFKFAGDVRNYSLFPQKSLLHSRDYWGGITKRNHSHSLPLSDQESHIVTSPLGPCSEIPNESLVNYVWKHTDKWLERPATTCGVSGRSYTYAMMRMLINRFAQALLGPCGMHPKEVVGLLLPNIPEFILVSHGALEANLIVTFVHPLYTPDEIFRQFDDAGVKLIVTFPLLLPIAKYIAPKLKEYRTTVCVGGEDDSHANVHGLQSLLMGGHQMTLPTVDPQDVALLPYSSGTTGLPKGVVLTHYNLVANLVQGDHPDLLLDPTTDKVQYTGLSVLPLFHIFGYNTIMNTMIKEGIHLLMIPKFTPDDYVKTLVKYKPNYLFVVPSLLMFLTSYPQITKQHLESVRCIMSGAAPLGEGHIQRFKDKVRNEYFSIRQGYGMTESSPVTIIMPKSTPISKIGTVGTLYPNTEARIINMVSGEDQGPHHSGELLVRGPQIMKEYLNNPKATADTVDKDGWLHTGDVAYYDDDRYFYIVDRTKELIKVKGHQVSPTELENIISELPDVTDVAVVGIPHGGMGEVPRAFIVKKPNSTLTEEQIIEYVNNKVINYKRLEGGVRFLDLIPRNTAGKILRQTLKIMN